MTTKNISIEDVVAELERGIGSRGEASLDLLKAVQKAAPSDASGLKEALTDLIIMQTRLNGRQHGLVKLVKNSGLKFVSLDKKAARTLGF